MPAVDARRREAHAAQPTRRELRGFAWSVGGAFAALAALALWRGRVGVALPCAVAGAALLLGGALAPLRLTGAHRAWMRLALAVSAITTPLLMGVVYFGVLTPIALVARLAGRRALGAPRDGGSAWVDRPPGARRSDLRRQF